jgi:biofilm PGA synthesis N-glycosyltransferase PgaC
MATASNEIAADARWHDTSADACPSVKSRGIQYLLFGGALSAAVLMFTVVPYQSLQFLQNDGKGGVPALAFTLSALFIALVSVIVGIRWCILFSLSFATYRRMQSHPRPRIEAWPFVSVFVPAYNESETIDAALESLRHLDYPHFEVLVVDDGSKDDTHEKALRHEGKHGGCAIRVFRKANGGKWSAHNFAFARCRAELILCLDADSRIEPESLKRLVAQMADPAVSAVSGQICVRNRKNLLTRLQALEYIMANGAMRMAQSASGTVLVVPGPIGLFRRVVLEEVFLRFGYHERSIADGEVLGPFEGDTFAEDFDLSLAILALGGRIVYEPHAVSRTKSPDWPITLLNQRYRWARGTIQVLRKLLARARGNPELLHPRLLAWVVGTYLLELLLVPVAYALGLGFGFAALFSGVNLLPLLIWFCGFLTINACAAALFTIMHRDRLDVLLALPFYDLYHGFLLNFGWLIAVIDEVRGTKMRW